MRDDIHDLATGKPVFPAPYEPLSVIMAIQGRPFAALLCAAPHFGAAIPLGIFTATVVSRLGFLAWRAADADIALFGGFLTAFTMMVSSSVLWVMANSVVSRDAAMLEALYRLQFALGSPGFSVPLGLLLAGISVTAGFSKLLPKWMAVPGVLIAVVGELGWPNILFPKALPLSP